MGAAPEQHIDIPLTGGDQEGVGIARRNDGVAMRKADAETAVGHDFGEG